MSKNYKEIQWDSKVILTASSQEVICTEQGWVDLRVEQEDRRRLVSQPWRLLAPHPWLSVWAPKAISHCQPSMGNWSAFRGRETWGHPLPFGSPTWDGKSSVPSLQYLMSAEQEPGSLSGPQKHKNKKLHFGLGRGAFSGPYSFQLWLPTLSCSDHQGCSGAPHTYIRSDRQRPTRKA